MCKHTFLSILLDLNFLKNQEESDTNGEEFLKKIFCSFKSDENSQTH